MQDIFQQFRANANPSEAAGMRAYMKDQFDYLGLKRPVRNEIQKAFIAEKKKSKSVDREFIGICWEESEREFQYLAMDYFRAVIRYAEPSDLVLMHRMIVTRPWWDTVDFIASNLVGALLLRHPELQREVVPWIDDDDMWVRRTALLYQLKYKDDTDTQFLEMAIQANLGSKEFFINKAIGWALRQYSKFDPAWVSDIIDKYPLAPLSVREGSKYL